MPPVVVALLAGAGLTAGIAWVAREMKRAANAARVAKQTQPHDESAASALKDLGTLEWDADAGVYRPARQR